MDLDLLRPLMTVVAFCTFMGILLWACSPRRARAFAEAEALPFRGEAPPDEAGGR